MENWEKTRVGVLNTRGLSDLGIQQVLRVTGGAGRGDRATGRLARQCPELEQPCAGVRPASQRPRVYVRGRKVPRLNSPARVCG